jgi:hypothetical protein
MNESPLLPCAAQKLYIFSLFSLFTKGLIGRLFTMCLAVMKVTSSPVFFFLNFVPQEVTCEDSACMNKSYFLLQCLFLLR